MHARHRFLLKCSAYVYGSALVGWFTAHLSFGDHWWWLFLLNVGSLYLFLPAPLLLLSALLFRQADLGLIGGAALGLALYLYGGLFLPRVSPAHAAGPHLTVMTYNALYTQDDSQAAVDTLRAAGADIIALQELNESVAEAIRQQLTGTYPYQLLKPQRAASGMGVISRYPLEPTGEQLPGDWVGPPQVLVVDYAGTRITFVNVHCISIDLAPTNWQEHLDLAVREREREAQALIALATRDNRPLIMVGDFNTSDQTMAYRIMSGTLHDAWREGGFGFGHTFPRSSSSIDLPLATAIWPFPLWMARIDYIFHSGEWRTVAAQTGPEGGTSDHRPVLVELALRH